MKKKSGSLFAIECASYTIVYFILSTFGGKLLFNEPFNWKGNLLQAILFGIFMAAFNYYSAKNGWFEKDK